MTSRQLIRFYPRAWRERYGAEFVDMMGDAPLSAQQTFDIVMGAIDARMTRRSHLKASMVRSTSGGSSMIEQLKLHCTSAPRYTKRDSLVSAAVLILVTAVMAAFGLWLKNNGQQQAAGIVLNLAFPIAVTISMPFALLKGQPRRAQVFVLWVTAMLLFLATWVATKI